MSIESQNYTARKATLDDIPALKEITNHDESRRLSAEGRFYHPENCMMVVEKGSWMIGSVFVLFARPPGWDNADDTSQLPQIISLVVKGEFRNQGAGTFLIGAVEDEVKSRGLKHVYLAVDKDDPGARRLYDRLGFVVISNEPYKSTWTYKDSDGVEHEEFAMVIDMVKQLS